MPKITYIKWGLGYVDKNGDIELHQGLRNGNENVRSWVIAHEKAHSQGVWRIKDLILDIYPTPLEVSYYVLRNPSTWTAILPIRIRKNQIRINPSACFTWAATIAITYIGIIYKVTT